MPTPRDHPVETRLIAIDLDGTLLDADGRITERTVSAVRSASEAGHRIVVATGRPPSVAFPATSALTGLVSHIVGANGTIVATFPDEQLRSETIRISGFPMAHAVTFVKALRARDVDFGFALATDAGFAHEPGFADLMPAAVGTDDVGDVLDLGGSTAFKLLVFHPRIALDRLLIELPPVIASLADDYAVRHMGADAAEIGPAGDDKCAGLQWLCAHLDVDAARVVAIGDELNDMRMIQWAGHGVAVANADRAVIAAADEVIGSHRDDGVARFLEILVTAGGAASRH